MVMESDKSYGPGCEPYQEDQALDPQGVYEVSKACTGYIARSYAKNYDLPVFTVRAANVYGPGDPNESRLVPNTIRRLQQGLRPQITAGADRYLREFIYVDDFVRTIVRWTIVRLMQEDAPWGMPINIGSGYIATVSQVVAMICRAMDKEVETERWEEDQLLVEIPNQSLDLSRLRKYLPDLALAKTIQEGIAATVVAMQGEISALARALMICRAVEKERLNG
jgi:nucleoside-diphosphate-sugar epimerase